MNNLKKDAAKALLMATVDIDETFKIKWLTNELIGLIKRLDSSRESVRDIKSALSSKTVKKSENSGFRVLQYSSESKKKEADQKSVVEGRKAKIIEIKMSIDEPKDILKYTNEEIIEILGKDIKKSAKMMGCTSTSRKIENFIDDWRIQILEENQPAISNEEDQE